MKRLLCLFLALLLLLPGCAAGRELTLSDALGTSEENAYTSPFGFVIDTEGLLVFSEDDLASLNQLDSFTPEALQTRMDTGNAVSIFAAASDEGASVNLSLYPAANLPESVQTPEEYAQYGLSVMPDKLTAAGYADFQVEQVSVNLDGAEHPAILCSAKITEDVPYYLLQICFRKDGWMASLSLSSMESEEDMRQLLTRITCPN